MSNEELVLRRRFIDFEEVFGDGWETLQRNLYKYFAKSFGCRLVDAGVSVPEDMVELLGKERFRTGLRLSFAVNEDILLIPHKYRHGFIGKADLFSWGPRESTVPPESFTWNEHVSWLTACYWYNRAVDGVYGSEWVADAKVVYFGSFAPLDENSRAEFIEKTKSLDESKGQE
ncbi:hypothetical protein GRF61_12195 [Azoarcus sp. TTM-91]|uniref:hypothetical protein n=1 Tax=Azoarcus sp. TTM-91 TaxID=2691581 RepID=UPI00145D3ED0|nr:hypothetical protein [Azoarcus sp. TTM-91]NMG35205.1 hypothetical protein [Azoarcus sp. TTM-91]